MYTYGHVWGTILLRTKTEHVLADLIEVVSLPFLRGMQYDDGGTQDGEQAANLAVKIQSLLQQVRGQHGTADRNVHVVCTCTSAQLVEHPSRTTVHSIHAHFHST